jgi:hypothetical protein
MNAHNPPITSPSPTMDRALLADARKVSGRDFLDAITGRSPEARAAEREQMIRQCIRAIENGDTYGWGPAFVAECREIIAERECGDLLPPAGWSRIEL